MKYSKTLDASSSSRRARHMSRRQQCMLEADFEQIPHDSVGEHDTESVPDESLGSLAEEAMIVKSETVNSMRRKGSIGKFEP
ncbi:hypothetical protein ColTof4_01763 [Colletotrichum tofieldiae]|nr:hypothetical protein ColTof3_09954 [Colletotrichum tofieldiae]GKT69340.1 hypothetical protein ColTof4_01763 [Colletotrichum tofieldiae]